MLRRAARYYDSHCRWQGQPRRFPGSIASQIACRSDHANGASEHIVSRNSCCVDLANPIDGEDSVAYIVDVDLVVLASRLHVTAAKDAPEGPPPSSLEEKKGCRKGNSHSTLSTPNATYGHRRTQEDLPMRSLSKVLFGAAGVVLAFGGFWAIKMIDNIHDNGEQFFIPAIALFAASAAAELIWGERRTR